MSSKIYINDFCEDQYCASWMCVNDDVLEEFANWLDEKNI